MSDKWRKLPEFPMYEITSEGDVRNRRTKRKLMEIQNPKTGAWSYSLRREDGKTSTHRNYWGLIYSAWPELKPEPKPVEPKRNYSRRGEWVDIPGFPRYQAHPEGLVRYTISRKHRKIVQDPVAHYLLTNDEGEHRKTVAWVLQNAFPVIVEEAA